jgi:hypothetical protein
VAEREGVTADPDDLVGLAGLAGEAEDERADVWLGVLDDVPVERLSEGLPAADPPPLDVLHAARTSTAATAHPPAHHRIPAPPGPRVPTSMLRRHSRDRQTCAAPRASADAGVEWDDDHGEPPAVNGDGHGLGDRGDGAR